MRLVSLTGDLQRDYDFLFSLYYVPKNLNLDSLSGLEAFKKVIDLISNQALLTYVSSLAMRIDVPSSELTTSTIQIGSATVTFPVSYVLSQFTVTYLDDNSSAVYNFHKGWQDSVKAGINFRLVYKYCLSCTWAVTERLPFGLDIPSTTPSNFPNIFPIKVTQSRLDKTGNNFRTVTVTYVRIPNITESASAVSKASDKVKSTLKDLF